MQTSHPRILLRWPLLATPVALSRPSRTCVVRTSTDKIWRMQQSEGHVLSSAARGPPLVFRRREHAESATKSAPWYFLMINKTEYSKLVTLLCCCFVAMVLWGPRGIIFNRPISLYCNVHTWFVFWGNNAKEIYYSLLSLKMISFKSI